MLKIGEKIRFNDDTYGTVSHLSNKVYQVETDANIVAFRQQELEDALKSGSCTIII